MKAPATITKLAKRSALALAILAAPVACALVFLALPATLAAQSCAMCYQSAAASGPRTIHAINNGILVLMFPPALITCGIFYLGFKKRNSYHDAEVESESQLPIEP
jgi:hypothetical protein